MMKDLSVKDLGQLVDLFIRGKHLDDAQVYLDEMQARINAAKLDCLNAATVETSEPVLTHKTLAEVAKDRGETHAEVFAAVKAASEPEPEPAPEGPPRDAQGNITRISTQIGDPGYDPEIHENQELKIFCDGVHILTAHTADTVKGLVRYYEKDGRGRIKTKERQGKVEIRGL